MSYTMFGTDIRIAKARVRPGGDPRSPNSRAFSDMRFSYTSCPGLKSSRTLRTKFALRYSNGNRLRACALPSVCSVGSGNGEPRSSF